MSLATLLYFFLNAQAAIVDNKNIQQITQNIKKEHQLIVEAEIKKRGVMGSLYEINKNLYKINGEIQDLEAQLFESKKTIEEQSATIARLEKVRDRQKVQLAHRLRALYKIGYHGYAQMLLSSHSSAELARNVKFLKIITKKDAELLKNYKESIIRIAAENNILKNRIRKRLITEKRLQADKDKYDEQRQKQLEILAEVEKNKLIHLAAFKELREAEFKFDEKIKSFGQAEAFSSLFFEMQGKLRPPITTHILQKYGIIVNNKFDTKIFHKGLFFKAHIGDPVAALYDGKVVHVGWVDGFGETVIIDHGDHYYSIYAHNSELLKKMGDHVKRGEIISLAGDSGSLRGPGLYFEIRHFSESLDPLAWLDSRISSKLL